MRRILNFFFCLCVNIGIAIAAEPCPHPEHIAIALKNVGRHMPTILKEIAQLKVEDVYIPDSVTLNGNTYTDTNGNSICAYYLASGATDMPLFIIKMGK